MHDKVSIEKSRIEQRVGYEARIHRANAPVESAALTTCSTNGAGYMSNADRFHSDTAGEEKEQRERIVARKKEVDEFKKNQVR